MPYGRAIARPRTTILIGAGVVLLASTGIPRLEIRADGRSLVPTGSPQIERDTRVRDDYGIDDQIALVVTADHPNGIFNIDSLQLVSDLTVRAAALGGAGAVTSLFTERGARVHTGTLEFRRLLDPQPVSDRQLQRLREDLDGLQLYTGTLVSHDGRSAAILIGVAADADRVGLYRQIHGLATARADAHHEIRVTGAPVAESLLGAHILDDLGVPSALTRYPSSRAPMAIGLVPLAIAVMTLIFLITFRSVLATLLPLCEVAACLLFVLGLMGWCGAPIYLPTTVMPVILTAVGLADEIHIFMRYRSKLAPVLEKSPGADHVPLVARTMAEMRRPVTRTSITTAIAFLSFAISPIGAVQSFGIFTAVGVLFCMAWSLTVIPAALVLARPGALLPAFRRDRPAGRPPRAALLNRFTRVMIRNRVAVVATVAVLFVAAVPAAGLLRVQDSWIDGFASDSEFRLATEAFNRDFLGMHVLLVTVDTAPETITGTVAADAIQARRIALPGDVVEDPGQLIGRWLSTGDGGRAVRIAEADRVDTGIVVTIDGGRGMIGRVARPVDEPIRFEIVERPLLSPANQQLVCELDEFIRAQTDSAVGGVLGPCEFLATTNYIVGGENDSARWVPADPYRLASTWLHYERVRGTQRLREVIDEKYSRTVLAVYMKDANFEGTQRLLDAVRSYAAENLAPHGLSVGFAGDVAVSQTLIDAIVGTQLRSLLLSLAGIFLVTSLMGRSPWWGLCCVLPCVTTVLIVFAAMGLAGVPLGVATSMFAGMTLGIGVDYAIHFMERYRLAANRGSGTDDAIAEAVAATGPAVAIDALAVGLGFGVLMLSQVPANARLGGLVVLAVAGCLVATLVLLPALVSLRPAVAKAVAS